MAIKKFTDFDNKLSLEDADYIVGYKADGTAEFKTTLLSLVEYLGNYFQTSSPEITPTPTPTPTPTQTENLTPTPTPTNTTTPTPTQTENLTPTPTPTPTVTPTGTPYTLGGTVFIDNIVDGYEFEIVKSGDIDYSGDVVFETNYTNNTISIWDKENMTSLKMQIIDVGSGNTSNVYINEFTSLTSVRIALTNFNWINIGTCNNLEKVDLSQNGSLVFEINACPNLSELKLLGPTENLNSLICTNCKLSSLALDQVASLRVLYCQSNIFETLDISPLDLLQFDCANNQLTALDVSNQINLTQLSCAGNQLSSLNLSNLTNLIAVWCMDNQLTTLDASNLQSINMLNCNNNKLTETAVNNILIACDALNTSDKFLYLQQGENAAPSGDGLTAKASLISKGWTVETN